MCPKPTENSDDQGTGEALKPVLKEVDQCLRTEGEGRKVRRRDSPKG